MKVYLVFRCVPYEGQELVAAYADHDAATLRAKEENEKCMYRNGVDFIVETITVIQ